MAMSSTGGGEGLSSEINVTPLIDVLLVLLIIFMITQPMSRKAFDVQVPPEQKSKQKQPPQSQIVLELKADGSYAINGQPYAVSQLEPAFRQIYDPRPAKLLFIKAAPNRKYLDVMQAMDIAHAAGVQVIGFTPPEPAKH
jgi:biopolymer transport protein TolR